jgi:hypothetical protein
MQIYLQELRIFFAEKGVRKVTTHIYVWKCGIVTFSYLLRFVAVFISPTRCGLVSPPMAGDFIF